MASLLKVLELLKNGIYDNSLVRLYESGSELTKQKNRYARVINTFAELFGEDRDIELFSAPGRTEVGGNHTDHNHGIVLAAGINLDAVAAVSKSNDNIIKVKSENYEMDTVYLSELEAAPKEKGKSVSLIRGVCAGFKKRGYKVGGFDAATASDVLSGSGLSSSAAFEVLICTIINHLYNNGKVSAVEIAQISQYAENEYFGKPCGLMDQTACSVGGFVCIDFMNPSKPKIKKINFDFKSSGHCLCIVNTGGSHSDLTDEYSSVRKEMESVAHALNKSVLRDVEYSLFIKNITQIREKTGDRAILRAMHFYNDNKRVLKQIKALEENDFETFKALVNESGRSSYMYNQNVYTCLNPQEQPVSLALALSESILKGCGAWRVHGGGFAGTIQAFLPEYMLAEYKEMIESVFGQSSCHVLSVRPFGGVKIE